MYNHNKAQQSKNRVHITWDIQYYRRCNVSNFDGRLGGSVLLYSATPL